MREHAVAGGWPRPDLTERAELARVLAAVPDDAVVLMDGLIASAVPGVLRPEARRLRLVILVHQSMGDDTEGEALASAGAIIATSDWTRKRLLDRYGLPAERVHVATPGVDQAALVPGSAGGTELLCVAALIPQKGYDVLTRALASIADLPWSCGYVGSLDRDPCLVDQLRGQVLGYGIAGRVGFAGPRTGPALDAAYAAADLLVLASRGETYGMVVTEALARGIPVLATGVGGVPEALGRAPDGSRPGLLVPPEDPAALAGALRRWLVDAALRDHLRHSARARRTTLTGWTVTAKLVANVLNRVPVACGRPA